MTTRASTRSRMKIWLMDSAVLVSVAERSSDELDGQPGRTADGQQMGRRSTCLVFTCATLIFTLRLCAVVLALMSRQQVCAYTRSRVCVQASISVYFCSPEPTHI